MSRKPEPSAIPQHRYSFGLILLVALSLWPAISAANPLVPLTPDKQFQYGQHCFEKGDYATAALEFKRFVYFFPDDERINEARYKTGMSYFNIKEYENALNQFSHILNHAGLTDLAFQSGLMISACYLRLNAYPSAIDNLQALAGLTTDRDRLDKIYYNLGMLHIAYGDLQSARSFFDKISRENYATYQVGAVCDALDRKGRIPQKSPAVGAIASIIPGGGYLYCQRYKDALFSFFLNSALIYAAYEGFDNGLYGLGGIIALVEAGFYAGNVYGGVSSVHKYNRAKQNEFRSDFKKRFGFDLSAGLLPERFFFLASYRF